MPLRLRTVLVLLGGIGLPRPLSGRQAAAHLHISLAQLRALERKALIGLRSRAHASRCAPAAGVSEAELLFAGARAASATGATSWADAAQRGAVGVASYRAAAGGGAQTRSSLPKLAPLTGGPGAGLARSTGDDLVIVLSAAAACLLLFIIVCAQISGLIGGSRGGHSRRGRNRGR